MKELALPILVALAALTLTYFFCLRPMRRGHCAATPQAGESAEREAEIARLRAEVAALRSDMGQRRDDAAL